MLSKIFIISVLIIHSLADNDLQKLFEDTKIVPDVIKTAPKEKLKVVFANDLDATDGIEITPTQAKDVPFIDWSADPNKLYTVYMGCPDAPMVSNPIMSEFLQWMVVNIPGKDIDKGDVYCPYLGPAVPKVGGMMRFVTLIYEQPGRIELDEPHVDNTSWKGHPFFKIGKIAEKYNLGSPLAGNIFRSKWDENVIVLNKMLGISEDPTEHI